MSEPCQSSFSCHQTAKDFKSLRDSRTTKERNMKSQNHCVEEVTSREERPYLTDTYAMATLLEDQVTEHGGFVIIAVSVVSIQVCTGSPCS